MINARHYRSLAAALKAATGGKLYIPAGTYALSEPLVYDATRGPISVEGDGAGTMLVGSQGAILRIVGHHGHAVDLVSVAGLRFIGNGAHTGLHMEGVAAYSLRDLYVNGNDRMAAGLRLTGTQQGEIAGGYVTGVADGVVLEKLPSSVASNGASIHGVSFMARDRHVVVDGADSMFLHACHLVGARIGVDVVSGGYGPLDISGNHIEGYETAIRFRGLRATIERNAFFQQGGTDVHLLDCEGTVIAGNSFTGSLRIESQARMTVVRDNISVVGGARTDLSTSSVYHDNRNGPMGGLF